MTDVATGEPVPGAVLDLWQADGEGIYDEGGDHLATSCSSTATTGPTSSTRRCRRATRSGQGPTTELLEAIGQHNWRPAHIHLRVHVGDTSQPLQTQFFMAGADYRLRPVDAVRDDLILEHHDAGDGAAATWSSTSGWTPRAWRRRIRAAGAEAEAASV